MPDATTTLRLSPEQFEPLHDQVRTYFERASSSMNLRTSPDLLERITRESLDPARSREQLAMLERCVGEPIAGKRILEAGSGNGLTVAVARCEFGADAHGLEPGDEEFAGSFAVSEQVLDIAGQPREVVERGFGEDMPYRDESFDCVFSSQVLEHVRDPAKVVAESLRVLRPGGTMHVVVPNYGSFWEGHYGTLWIPHQPLWMARLWVRLLGHDPKYLSTLSFVSHGTLRRALRPHRDSVEVLGWGIDVWEERLRSASFSTWGSLGTVERWVRRLHRLGLVSVLIAIGRRLHWQSPVILTVRKRPTRPGAADPI